jgi:hypothetical protein
MNTSLGTVLDRLNQPLEIFRHEIRWPELNDFRSVLQNVLGEILDREGGQEAEQEDSRVLDELRVLRGQLLTGLVMKSSELPSSGADIVKLFGDLRDRPLRWGEEIPRLATQLMHAAARLKQAWDAAGHPGIKLFNQLVRAEQDKRRSVAILCHKNEFDWYRESVQPTPKLFHNAHGAYLSADPVETLIRFGPLKVRGWGQVPETVLTVPKYSKLVQILWSGLVDEPGFGYNPLEAFLDDAQQPAHSSAGERLGHAVTITIHDIPLTVPNAADPQPAGAGNVDDANVVTANSDDFESLREKFRTKRKRYTGDRTHQIRLELAQVFHGEVQTSVEPYGEGQHLLVLGEGGDALGPKATTMSASEVESGMYVIRAIDTNGASMHDDERHHDTPPLARQWKEKLQQRRLVPDFVEILRQAGIGLVTLESRLDAWQHAGSCAPQASTHFMILLKKLGYDATFIARALREIERLRGTAISEGQQAMDDGMIKNLERLGSAEVLENIKQKAGEQSDHFVIDADGVRFSFHRVLDVATVKDLSDDQLESVDVEAD